MKESALYPPIKAFLEAQGYEVKAEIGHLDIMACRGAEPPLIIELKTSLNLNLILQGVARQTLSDLVYLAVPQPRKWSHRYRDLTALLRRLGLGLITLREGKVEVHLDPGPYQPRPNTAGRAKLLREFQRREGDPNIAGTTGIKRMTAYRQEAIRLARALEARQEAAPRDLAADTGLASAGAVLRADYYGWFIRIAPGRYTLTEKGRAACLAASS